MNDIPVPASLDRLTELVVQLSGAPGEAARGAVEDAVARNGRWGDNLLNVADALVAVRSDLRGSRERVPAGASAGF